jgi:Lon protease-like protein
VNLENGTVVPLFPLSDLVFFPSTVIPLHVFESRYRAMVRDASAGPNLVGMALLRPGYEKDYEGSPEIHSVGTVGLIEKLRPFSDGRYMFDLRGLARVTYHEIQSGKTYRTARVILRPEVPTGLPDAVLEPEKLDLLSTHALLLRALSGTGAPALALNDRISFAAAVNRACVDLPVPAELRQALLVEDDLQERQRRVSRLLNEILQHVLAERFKLSPGDLPS